MYMLETSISQGPIFVTLLLKSLLLKVDMPFIVNAMILRFIYEFNM
jgi:hypothetical protein